MERYSIMNKKELLELYKEAISDATGWYLSYFCASQEDEENRLKNDKEAIEYFKKILYDYGR